MIYAIYNKETGVIYRSVECPEFVVESIPLNKQEAIIRIDRTADDENEYIKNGVLTPKELTDDTAN